MGFVLLIVTLAIVLLIVAKSWQSAAPAAIQVSRPDEPAVVDDHGQTEAGEALRQGRLPDLRDMRAETKAHADQVQEALAETE